MLLQNIGSPVQVQGGSQQSSFSIALNGKAFRVLSDTLYQNKIGSIVREISCNAYDAHVAAGKKDVPFEIHLPDAFEPWFAVKDYGVGLSKDEITGIFTVYFQSTKDQSNDSIGAFGLGAKTPFSYTDQFTVTSCKNNIRTVYSAYINEQGVPNIIEMISANTDEPNGVEIKMSVKREDYQRFATETQQQLKFFKVKPKIVNAKVNFQEKPEAFVDTDNIFVSAEAIHSYTSSIFLVQGNVGYPLDMNQISPKEGKGVSQDNYNFLTALRGHTVYLKFNIGEIGVTASREGVEYTEDTIRNINRKLDKVRLEVQAEALKLVKDIDNLWEQVKVFNDIPLLRKFADPVSFFNKNKNIFVSSTNISFDVQDFLSREITLPEGTKTKERAEIYSLTKFRPNYRNRVYFSGFRVTPSNTTCIAFRDTRSKALSRLQQLLIQNNKVDVIEILIPWEVKDWNSFITEFKKLIGDPQNVVFKLSNVEIPVTVRAVATRAKYKKTSYWKYKKGVALAYTRNWDKVKESDLSNIKEKTLYLLADDSNVPSDVQRAIVTSLYIFNYSDKTLEIIAIRSKDLKEAEENPNLIPIQEYVEDSIKTILVDNTAKANYLKSRISNCVGIMLSKVTRIYEYLLKHCPGADITKIYTDHLTMKTSLTNKDIEKCYVYERIVGVEIKEEIDKILNSEMKNIQAIKDKYELVEAITPIEEKAKEALAKYVALVYNSSLVADPSALQPAATT